MQKSAVRDAIVAQLQKELDLQSRAALDAREEATSTESKQEGKYDMRGQEAAYLAEGQARLAAEIAESITLYRSITLQDLPAGAAAAVGALVSLESAGRTHHYFLGPRNGGIEVDVAGTSVTVVTPTSPLGRLLVGQRVGTAVEMPGRGSRAKQRISAIV